MAGIKTVLNRQVDSRYKLKQVAKNKKRLLALFRNDFFKRWVQSIRQTYKIPAKGFSSEEQLPEPYENFEKEIVQLRHHFRLSSRWHLPISLYITHGIIDSSFPVCGLEFYKGKWKGDDSIFLIRIFGDTTEMEYRMAWKTIKKMQSDLTLGDKEQFRYSNYLLDEQIVKFYLKYKKNVKIMCEKLCNYFSRLGIEDLAKKCTDVAYIRVRLHRALNRTKKINKLRVIDFKDLKKISVSSSGN